MVHKFKQFDIVVVIACPRGWEHSFRDYQALGHMTKLESNHECEILNSGQPTSISGNQTHINYTADCLRPATADEIQIYSEGCRNIVTSEKYFGIRGWFKTFLRKL